MAKKETKQDQSELSAEEQLDLIEVKPENSKEMVEVVKRYKAAQSQRMEALGREVAEKQKLLALIKKAKLQHLDDGRIQFRVDRLIITVTPRDELIRIKDENENNDEEVDMPDLPGTEG